MQACSLCSFGADALLPLVQRVSFEMFEEEEYSMAKIVIVDDEREILEPLQDMLEGKTIRCARLMIPPCT